MGVVAGAAALYVSLNITVREMPSRARPAPLDLIGTGVARIDRELSGGIPFPSDILIMGPSGSGKTSITSRILCRSLEEDISVVQLCLDYEAGSVRRLAGMCGIRCEEYENQNRLILVEGYIHLAGITPKERFTTTRDLTDLSINITSALNQLQGSRKLLIIDSLTGIAEESGPERMLKFIRTIAAKTSHSGTGFIATINPDAITPIFSALIQELFHGILELQVTEGGTSYGESGLLRCRAS